MHYMTLFGKVIKNLRSLEPNSNAYLWKGGSNLSCISQFHYKGKFEIVVKESWSKLLIPSTFKLRWTNS